MIKIEELPSIIFECKLKPFEKREHYINRDKYHALIMCGDYLMDGKPHTIKIDLKYWTQERIQKAADDEHGHFGWVTENMEVEYISREEWVERLTKAKPYDIEVCIDEESN